MLRYVSEYKVSPAGTRLSVPIGSQFKAVVKESSHFVIVAEVVGDQTSERIDIDIVIKRANAYIHPKAKYIASVLVGAALYHFYAQPVGVEDGSDAELLVNQTDPKAPPPAEA